MFPDSHSISKLLSHFERILGALRKQNEEAFLPGKKRKFKTQQAPFAGTRKMTNLIFAY